MATTEQRAALVQFFADRVAKAHRTFPFLPAEHDLTGAARAGDVHGEGVRAQDRHAEHFEFALAARQAFVVLEDARVQLGKFGAQSFGRGGGFELFALAGEGAAFGPPLQKLCGDRTHQLQGLVRLRQGVGSLHRRGPRSVHPVAGAAVPTVCSGASLQLCRCCSVV